jgi:hypothetical protein
LFRYTDRGTIGPVPKGWLVRERRVPKSDKARVGGLAGRQFGRVSRAQLLALGVENRTVTSWAARDYLYPELPRVYAVGHPDRSDASDLFAAILFAGPEAGLGGLTAALWRGLVKWRTQDAIEVSTPRRCRSLPAAQKTNRLGREIIVRERRKLGRATYHRIPTIPVENIVLDLAAAGELELVRFALAQLDFMRRLNVAALERVCGPGVPGTRMLQAALGQHQPLLARARSPFEIKLIGVCELTGIPLPELNVKIGDITPDAVWREQMVVVECDGEGNHGTWAQRKRDAANDLRLRALGFLPIRYTYQQLDDPWAIHADLTGILDERQGRAAAS